MPNGTEIPEWFRQMMDRGDIPTEGGLEAAWAGYQRRQEDGPQSVQSQPPQIRAVSLSASEEDGISSSIPVSDPESTLLSRQYREAMRYREVDDDNLQSPGPELIAFVTEEDSDSIQIPLAEHDVLKRVLPQAPIANRGFDHLVTNEYLGNIEYSFQELPWPDFPEIVEEPFTTPGISQKALRKYRKDIAKSIISQADITTTLAMLTINYTLPPGWKASFSQEFWWEPKFIYTSPIPPYVKISSPQGHTARVSRVNPSVPSNKSTKDDVQPEDIREEVDEEGNTEVEYSDGPTWYWAAKKLFDDEIKKNPLLIAVKIMVHFKLIVTLSYVQFGQVMFSYTYTYYWRYDILYRADGTYSEAVSTVSSDDWGGR
jgi:hypothetical protein